MKQLNYILKRILQMIPVLFVVTIVVFLMIHMLPGDPARTLLGERATYAQVEALQIKLGLNRPLPVQYWLFLKHLFRLDLGNSVLFGVPVANLLGQRLFLTLSLTLFSGFIALLISLPLGYIAAARKDRVADHLIRTGALIALSTPVFWIALLLMMLFALKLRWLPVGGWGRTPMEHFMGLILPAFTLSLSTAALLVRNLRNNIVDISRSDYVDFARSKGLSENIVRARHILRNSLISTATLLSLQLAHMLGGSVITETVFNLPGLGSLMIQAIFGRDYAVVQGGVFVIAVMVLFVNLITDVLYSLLDPRVALD